MDKTIQEKREEFKKRMEKRTGQPLNRLFGAKVDTPKTNQNQNQKQEQLNKQFMNYGKF